MEGCSIKELSRQRSITQDLVFRYANEVASALKHLHGESIIWNGCCVDHVLVNARGQLRLMNFGLSQDESGDSAVDFRHVKLGRFRWMAPESFRDLQYSPKTDIWAFGCFVVEILT